MQNAGAWELDTYYFSSDRRLYFDLRNLVPGSGSVDAPTAIIVAPGRLITKCDATGNLLEMNPVLPLFNCALHGRFAYNGRTYLVRMDAASSLLEPAT